MHQILALGLLAGCGALFWFGAVEPVVGEYFTKRQEVQDARELLARYKAIADYRQQVSEFVATTEQQHDSEAFLSGDSEQIAVANLQSHLQSIAANSGATFRSASSLTPKTDEKLKLAGVQIALSGPLQSIHQTIHSIETGKPYLFIERAQLQPQQFRVGNRNNRQPVVLNAQLHVYGVLADPAAESE